MEGATDRRKDEDSPERESKALDDFREEIRERHGDSDDDKDNVQTNSGALSGKQDNASDTKPNEDVSETERSLERVKPSIVAEEKSERSEEFQVGTSNTEGGTAGRSEPSAEREAGHTDLEQFRDEVRKKYPEWAGNENHLSEDSDRTFRSEAENSGVLDSQTSKRVEWDGSDPPTGMHNIGTVEAVSQKDERNGIAEEADQPPFERVVQEVSFSAPKGNLGGGSRETGPENEKLNGSETANPNAEEVGDAEAHRFSDLERQRNAIEERSPNLQETSLHPEEKGVARVDTPREAGGWRTKESIGTSQKRDGAEPTSTTRAIGQGLQKEVENPDRGLAEASLRPYFSGSDRYRAVQFELRKSQLEDLCRTKLETGKIYRISGRIDGVCEFETFRRVSTASTLRINVPKDFHGRVERGQRYNVVISSIEEKKIDPSLAKILGGPQEMQKNVNISKWFQDRESLYQSVGSERVAGDDKSVVSIARQNFGRDGFHFNVSKSDIERSSGVVLGEGKRYEFKVTVGEMGQFVARHTQKRNDEIPIFVPLIPRQSQGGSRAQDYFRLNNGATKT